MNPIMESLYPSGIQPTQPQQQATQPQQGIASLSQATPSPQGGNLAGLSRLPDPGNLPMGQTPLMGMPPAVTDANIGDIQKLLDQQAGYGLNPPQQPGTGNFNHLTDNPYVAGPPDNFVTIEGVRYNVPPVSQQPGQPTQPPPQQTPTPPQTLDDTFMGMYRPGVMPPGWQNQQQFNPNQGIASLAGTSPGI